MPRILLPTCRVQLSSAAPILALLAGSAAGLAWPAPLPVLLVAMIAGAAIALTAFGRANHVWCVAGVCAACACGGAALAGRAWDEAWRPTLVDAFDHAVGGDDSVIGIVTGVLRTDARVTGEQVSLDVAALAIEVRGRGRARTEETFDGGPERPAHGGVVLTVAGTLASAHAGQWRAGRTIRAPVHLRRPTTHRNPGSIDEARALARRGTVLIGSVKSAVLVEMVSLGSWRTEAAAGVRAFVRRAVARHVGQWDAVAAGIVTAILIGDRAGLGADTERSLQEAGTYHVIAISGGNIAILATLIVAAFRWAGVLGRAAMATAIVLLLAYGHIVEGGASVDRAVAVAVLYFAVRALDHRLPPLRGLLVAAGGLVAADPLAIADPGFLLSFGATLGILTVSPLAVRETHGAAVRTLTAMFVASVAAEVMLLPVLAFFFGRVTVAGVALNYLAIPLMAVVQVAGLLLIPFAAVAPIVADGAGWVAARSASLLVASASVVAWVPLLAWRVARPSAWIVLTYYATLGGTLMVWRRDAGHAIGTSPTVTSCVRAVCVTAACASALWIAAEPWTLSAARGDGRLRIVALDVGQGDATLIRFPAGSTMLVDAGGTASSTYDIGDRVVIPALRYLGVRRLDTLVVTHGDVDHIGGATAVLHEFRPFDVWEGVPVPRAAALRVLREAADSHAVRWTQVQRADVVTIDGVEVRVHHPPRPDWERQDPRNDDSVVLELRWRDVSIVLPGDIGHDVETALTGDVMPARLRVLKVPHHGSATSSSARFLEHLRPRVAIVSAGRANAFGHPTPAVLKRYELLGASVFRTDEDGAVTITTDGGTLDIESVGGRRARLTADP